MRAFSKERIYLNCRKVIATLHHLKPSLRFMVACVWHLTKKKSVKFNQTLSVKKPYTHNKITERYAIPAPKIELSNQSFHGCQRPNHSWIWLIIFAVVVVPPLAIHHVLCHDATPLFASLSGLQFGGPPKKIAQKSMIEENYIVKTILRGPERRLTDGWAEVVRYR